jgi:single-stranded-DNA-specific exonuclease
MRAAGLLGRPLTAGRVGFILAPRLNAAGRLGHALRGVELLLSESDAEANPIARELEELNARRQDLDRRTLEEAREMISRINLDDTYGIVLWNSEWHPGVIGIVASRVVEEFCRPTMMIAVKDGEGKGSGRSIPAFNLHSGLAECRGLLKRFGGHRAAAGITVDESQLEAFAAKFNEVAKAQLRPEDLVPELRVDLELNIDAADSDLEKVLRHFEPFGMGNPSPVFVARNVRLGAAPEVVGRDGLKLRLATASGTIEALGWGMADRADEFKPNQNVDVAFRLERDEYRGEIKLQARIADIFPHQDAA